MLDTVSEEGFKQRSVELGETLRARLDAIATRIPAVGEVRGLGPMIALELVTNRETRAPATELAAATVAAARERGLLLLSCGLYSNVIRILVPLVVESDDLEHGLGILEESLAHAASG